MAYEVRYRVDSITARDDGSELVQHDIWAEGREESDEDWAVVPGHHKSLLVPATEVQAALSGGSTQFIIAEYKLALVENVNTKPTPVTGWTKIAIQAKLAANANAVAAAAAVNAFVTDTLGQTFPVRFTL